MRILFSALPAFGHLMPMAPLALALTRRGHEVRVASGEDVRALVEGWGLGFEPAGLGIDAGREAMARSGRRGESAETTQRFWDPYTYTHRLPVAVEPKVDDLIALGRLWRPDLVIHDPCDFPAPLAAAVLGVPSLLQGWGVPFTTKMSRRANRAAVPTWTERGVEPPAQGALFRGGYLDQCPPELRPDDAVIEVETFPLRPSPVEAELSAADAAALAGLPPSDRVLITLGTVVNERRGRFRDLVATIAAPGRSVVLLTGQSDPSRLRAEVADLPGDVLVLGFGPLDRVLDSVDVVVHHGGAGTLLAVLRHGLASVIVPMDGDQRRNADRAVAAGAAVIAESDDEVPAALARVAGADADPAVAAAAGRVAASIAAMPDVDRVAAQVEEYATRG